MGSPFDRIRRCMDLGEAELVAASSTREQARALLAKLAEVSAPDTGAAKVLLLMARIATSASEWLEGDLRVELTVAGESTVLDTTTDIGGGMLERVLPRATLRAPLGEFARALDRVPRLVQPLTVRTKTAGRILLTVSSSVRRSTAPPPSFAISEDALFASTAAAPAAQPVPAFEHEPITATLPATLPVVGSEPAPRNPTDPPLDNVDEGWGD